MYYLATQVVFNWQLFFPGTERFSFEVDQRITFFGSLALLAAGLGMVACLVTDAGTRTRRDWVHWLGVLARFLSNVAQPILMMIASRYLSMQDLYGN